MTSRLRVKPELSLAFSLYSGPGTYALLLGSGVSRAAGVPTGWEVTLDLVRKLAAAQGKTATNPEAWYRERFGREPNYSEVVDELAPTRDERRALLQRYFEPDDEDREEGSKVPTEAHRAIAWLCAAGYVRLVLTTNFDRLLERALEVKGVSPVVIDTPYAVEGAPPLQHARCTVVKVNGDYLDTRIKNTPEELAEYEPRMNKLLERVFSEYGLVISGWSGTYDIALIDALKRTGSRRYMTYWISRGRPSEAELSLTSFLGGTSIQSEGADEFFADLLEKVEALETFGGDDPLSAPVAAATAKRYLDEPERNVRLREFVSSVGREARERLFGEGRFSPIWGPEATGEAGLKAGLAEEMKRRVRSYERTCEVAAGVMAAGGYYANEHQADTFRELLELVANPPKLESSFNKLWEGLELYPALLLLYTGGIAATATENWSFLKTLLRESRFTDISGTRPLILNVHPWAVDYDKEDITVAALFDGSRRFEPMADWLHETLREPLGEYLPLNFRYDAAFHRFEALLALTYVDINKRQDPDYDDKRVPLGRFAYLHKTSRGKGSDLSALRAEYDEQRGQWGPIESGLLEEPTPSGGGVKTVETVDYDFKVVEDMIGSMSYF